MELIDGKAISEAIKKEISEEVQKRVQEGKKIPPLKVKIEQNIKIIVQSI